jgi:pimeloyl-ACP methyl ester carboxylesterase
MEERSTEPPGQPAPAGPSVPAGGVPMPPVQDRTVLLHGLPFHYREWGPPTAPPLLLLHGYTGNARTWDTVAQALTEAYRVLALDLRGHGESPRTPDGRYPPAMIAGDVQAFAAALGLRHVPIVGFSFGGHAAYAVAAAQPGQVSRLVLVETGVPPAGAAMRASLQAWCDFPELYDTPQAAVDTFAACGVS